MSIVSHAASEELGRCGNAKSHAKRFLEYTVLLVKRTIVCHCSLIIGVCCCVALGRAAESVWEVVIVSGCCMPGSDLLDLPGRFLPFPLLLMKSLTRNHVTA